MIINKISEIHDSNYWDFTGVKKEGLHIIGKYPATMVAPMQYELLSILINQNKNLKTLLDPFMGSATSLVEGYSLGLKVTGIDINPYAVLLGEVKTHKYNERDLNDSLRRVNEKLAAKDYKYEVHEFYNINKWFRNDIIDSLSKIRYIILQEKNEWIRKFLWVCLSEVIYTHSNTRTSTFKLHTKTEEDIKSIKNNCECMFLTVINKNKDVLNKDTELSVDIYTGDSIKVLDELNDESFDIICTSPPYGDNATTVTYGQASILFLKWIDISDLTCPKELISNYSRIDTVSLGGRLNRNQFPNIPIATSFINELSSPKKGKVKRFISDYYVVLKKLYNVLKKDGYMLFTVGNRRVDGIQQPLDRITEEIFKELKLTKIDIFTRNISAKKIPLRISNVKNRGSVKSMNKETVIIYKKEN